jgi:hypothetical protein
MGSLTGTDGLPRSHLTVSFRRNEKHASITYAQDIGGLSDGVVSIRLEGRKGSIHTTGMSVCGAILAYGDEEQ